MGLRIDIDVVAGLPVSLYFAPKLNENDRMTWKNKRNSLEGGDFI